MYAPGGSQDNTEHMEEWFVFPILAVCLDIANGNILEVLLAQTVHTQGFDIQ